MIKNILRFLLPFSALIPATLLVAFCILMLIKCITGYIHLADLGYILTSLLGILGYIGLFRLFMVGSVRRNKYTIALLIAGVLSFLLFVTLGGVRAWTWVLTFQEPDEWFLIVWPTIVSIFYIVKIILKPDKFE